MILGFVHLLISQKLQTYRIQDGKPNDPEIRNPSEIYCPVFF
jgi:hypothetical protein